MICEIRYNLTVRESAKELSFPDLPGCKMLARRESILFTALREEPGPEGEERGGCLPIPRRDEKAGRVWPQPPERLPVTGHISDLSCRSESLSVCGCPGHSDEQSASAVCEEREGSRRYEVSETSEYGRHRIRDHPGKGRPTL